MEQLRLSRRDILKGAAAAGGLAAASTLIGPLAVLADGESDGESIGPFGPWSTPRRIAELASTSNDYHPAISRHGRSLYFTTDRVEPPLARIVVSHWDDLNGQWGPPVLVDALNSSGSNSGVPNVTSDGHVMFFQSNRPGGAGAGDIYMSHRRHTGDDFGWEAPISLPGQVNTSAAESAATYFRNPATDVGQLYFARFAGIGVIGQPDQDFDIYVSLQGEDGNFGPGQIVTSLNAVPQAGDPPHTWSRDTRTAIRRDGHEMFITSNRHGGLSYSGGPIENLWVATRADTTTEDWSTPQLVPNVNSGQGDGGPALSRDATTLYFFSQRTAAGKPGKRQLWLSTRSRLEDDSGR